MVYTKQLEKRHSKKKRWKDLKTSPFLQGGVQIQRTERTIANNFEILRDFTIPIMMLLTRFQKCLLAFSVRWIWMPPRSDGFRRSVRAPDWARGLWAVELCVTLPTDQTCSKSRHSSLRRRNSDTDSPFNNKEGEATQSLPFTEQEGAATQDSPFNTTMETHRPFP